MKRNTQQLETKPAWSRGKLVGQKAPLRLKEIWAIRVRLQLAGDIRRLALFDLAIDSKLRACDLVSLRVRDVARGSQIAPRTSIIQRKTQHPVQFEIPSRLGKRLAHGSRRAICGQTTTYFRVASTTGPISPPVSTPASSRAGFAVLGWTN